jgi:anti-sigma regulatory factor (Ser/Thr protein kinase)
MPWKFALQFDVDPAANRLVRKVVVGAAQVEGASETEAYAIEASLGEVFSNAFRHAYHWQPGPLGVEVAYDGVRLNILVHDHGAPITDVPVIPTTRPPRGQGSRGLFLVGQLMDEAEVVHPYRDGRGTAVRMIKYLR